MPTDRCCDGRAPGRDAQPLTDLCHPPPHSASRHREPTVSPDGRPLACDACEAETCAASHRGHAVGGMRHMLISYPRRWVGFRRIWRAPLPPGPAALRALGTAMSSDAPSQGAGLITGGQALLEVADLVPCGEVSALRGEIASRFPRMPAGGAMLRKRPATTASKDPRRPTIRATHRKDKGWSGWWWKVRFRRASCASTRLSAVWPARNGGLHDVSDGCVTAGVDGSCAMPRWLTGTATMGLQALLSIAVLAGLAAVLEVRARDLGHPSPTASPVAEGLASWSHGY
jgi:hypothetical protein